MKRIVVTGSRDHKGLPVDSHFIYQALLVIVDTPSEYTIFHGGAPGADQIASIFCRETGTQEVIVTANWHIHGRAAGPIRNTRMLSLAGLDAHVLAFPKKQSKGTIDCMDKAKRMGMKVSVFEDV